MPAGEVKGEAPNPPERWRQYNLRLLRNQVANMMTIGGVGGGSYPDHEPPFTPEEVANICVDECYLQLDPDNVQNIEIEGYESK